MGKVRFGSFSTEPAGPAWIFFAVMASNIAWHWAPNNYVAALIGVGLAIGATQIVTGIQFLAAVLRRNRRP
jgi:hypothetical protein